VFLGEFPASTNLQVYEDFAFVVGDAYYTQIVYRDVGSTTMRRFTAISSFAFPAPGDLFKTGAAGSGEAQSFSFSNFPPLKLAMPTDGPMTTGFSGDNGESAVVRSWFSPSAATASMAAVVGEHIVVTGLTSMGRQHLYLHLNVSGAANSVNNGSFRIVEILSATSVRVHAPQAAGADANNGGLTWSLSGPVIDSPTYFTAINTQDIGVG